MANPELDFATVDFNYDLSLDGRVLGFTLSLSILTGIIFGLLPALQASKADLASALKGESATAGLAWRRFGLRNLLVVAQVALSLVPLVSAGLFIKSMRHAQELSPGFETKNILLASVDVGLHGYDKAKGQNFFKQIVERIKSLPSVEEASLAAPLPLDAYNYGARVIIEGYTPRHENERISVGYSIVGDNYFKTMNTPIVAGRAFSEYDNEKAPRVVVINETMAERYWPDQNPVGKRLQMGSPESPYLEIVGIAKDGKYNMLGEPPTEYMFVPFLQNYDGKMTLITRTVGQPEKLAAAIRQEVASFDSELPVYGIRSMPKYLDRILSGPKSIAGLVSVFGLVALMMAAVGLYGVMTYSVTQRTRETGIRMALGAQQMDVLRLVISQGMQLAAAGIALGLAASFFLTRLLSSLLFSVSTTDPLTYAAVSVMLTGVALLACVIPARRATKVDPMIALRQE